MTDDRSKALAAAENLADGLTALLSYSRHGPALASFAFAGNEIGCVAESVADMVELELAMLISPDRGFPADDAGAELLGQFAAACRKFASDWAS